MDWCLVGIGVVIIIGVGIVVGVRVGITRLGFILKIGVIGIVMGFILI